MYFLFVVSFLGTGPAIEELTEVIHSNQELSAHLMNGLDHLRSESAEIDLSNVGIWIDPIGKEKSSQFSDQDKIFCYCSAPHTMRLIYSKKPLGTRIVGNL